MVFFKSFLICVKFEAKPLYGLLYGNGGTPQTGTVQKFFLVRDFCQWVADGIR